MAINADQAGISIPRIEDLVSLFSWSKEVQNTPNHDKIHPKSNSSGINNERIKLKGEGEKVC